VRILGNLEDVMMEEAKAFTNTATINEKMI
jgi:hypothetical protein